jgi:hypothetical protein
MSTDSNTTATTVLPIERIKGSIHVIRGQKVMLDRDLASLYGVQPKALVQAVKRNAERFPADFMFRLTSQELATLRSQSVTEKLRRGERYAPFVFTELGVAMLSSVLRSPRALQVNIEIMRAFVLLRQFALTHEELNRRIDSLESKFDSDFKRVFAALRELMKPEPDKAKPTAGFAREENQIGCWPCR